MDIEESSRNGSVNGCNNNNNNNISDDYSYDPCYFLKEALNAILKCLGLESSKEICWSDNTEKKNKYDFNICHEQISCTHLSLPLSTETDLVNLDPDPFLESAETRGRLRRRTPPRPPVTGGPDPQTNSNPSF